MHISDGVLSAPVWMGSCAVAALVTAGALSRMKPEQIPKIAVVSSFFFVASLIPVPLPPTKVHLMLNGLAGIVLGVQAFPCILVGLFLQVALFGHGGWTTLGANMLIMGLSAVIAFLLFELRHLPILTSPRFRVVLAFFAGASGVFFASLFLALGLVSSGEEFSGVAKLAILWHLPVMAIEGLVTVFAISFLQRVKPEILEAR